MLTTMDDMAEEFLEMPRPMEKLMLAADVARVLEVCELLDQWECCMELDFHARVLEVCELLDQ